MNIKKTLLSLLLGEDFYNKTESVFSKLKKNDYDLIAFLKAVDLSEILDLISAFLEKFPFNFENGSVSSTPVSSKPYQNCEDHVKFNVRRITNSEIYTSLANYFKNNGNSK